MARAFNDRGGDPGGTGRKRGRRRAPTVAAGDLTEAVEANGSGHPQALRLGVASAAVAVLAPPEPEVAGSNGGPLEVPVPDVYKQREASVEAGPHPAPTVLQAAPDKPHDEFGDLLGQAVGLRLDSVSREFGGDNEMRVTALRDVSIDIGPGEFVAVVGPSGCGKSTLLSLMGGLDRPSSGHVYAAGLPLGELSDGDLANYRLQRVGTIFQSFNLVPSMSVEDNVALPPTLAGVGLEERRRRARHLLDLVGLTAHARRRASRLSGGEQ